MSIGPGRGASPGLSSTASGQRLHGQKGTRRDRVHLHLDIHPDTLRLLASCWIITRSTSGSATSGASWAPSAPGNAWRRGPWPDRDRRPGRRGRGSSTSWRPRTSWRATPWRGGQASARSRAPRAIRDPDAAPRLLGTAAPSDQRGRECLAERDLALAATLCVTGSGRTKRSASAWGSLPSPPRRWRPAPTWYSCPPGPPLLGHHPELPRRHGRGLRQVVRGHPVTT